MATIAMATTDMATKAIMATTKVVAKTTMAVTAMVMANIAMPTIATLLKLY